MLSAIGLALLPGCDREASASNGGDLTEGDPPQPGNAAAALSPGMLTVSPIMTSANDLMLQIR